MDSIKHFPSVLSFLLLLNKMNDEQVYETFFHSSIILNADKTQVLCSCFEKKQERLWTTTILGQNVHWFSTQVNDDLWACFFRMNPEKICIISDFKNLKLDWFFCLFRSSKTILGTTLKKKRILYSQINTLENRYIQTQKLENPPPREKQNPTWAPQGSPQKKWEQIVDYRTKGPPSGWCFNHLAIMLPCTEFA